MTENYTVGHGGKIYTTEQRAVSTFFMYSKSSLKRIRSDILIFSKLAQTTGLTYSKPVTIGDKVILFRCIIIYISIFIRQNM